MFVKVFYTYRVTWQGLLLGGGGGLILVDCKQPQERRDRLGGCVLGLSIIFMVIQSVEINKILKLND